MELPIKETEGKQLLASELMTRIRNKGFANSHGRLPQTGDWICLQFVVESMEAALKARQARDLRTRFVESRTGVTDRFELLALTLLHGMTRARLELPDGLADLASARDQLERHEMAKILRREIASTEEINVWSSRAHETDRYDVLAESVLTNVQTWESAHAAKELEVAEERTAFDYPRARTRFIAEFLRTELGLGLPEVSPDSVGYFVTGSGSPFPEEASRKADESRVRGG